MVTMKVKISLIVLLQIQIPFCIITPLFVQLPIVHCQDLIHLETLQTTKDNFSIRKHDLNQGKQIQQRGSRRRISTSSSSSSSSSSSTKNTGVVDSSQQKYNSRRRLKSKYGRMGKSMKMGMKKGMKMKMGKQRKRKNMYMHKMKRRGRNIFKTVRVECSSDIEDFTSLILAVFNGNPDSLTAEEIVALESSFRQTYNDLTFQRCDGYFRSIQEVTLNTTQFGMPRRRELHERQRRLVDFQAAQRYAYSIVATCRNCPITSSGWFSLFDNSLRRTLSEVYLPLGQKERSLQDDICICEADFSTSSYFMFDGRRMQTIPPNAPTEEEFLIGYNIRIQELIEEGVVVNIISVSEIVEDSPSPARSGRPPFANSRRPPFARPAPFPTPSTQLFTTKPSTSSQSDSPSMLPA